MSRSSCGRRRSSGVREPGDLVEGSGDADRNAGGSGARVVRHDEESAAGVARRGGGSAASLRGCRNRENLSAQSARTDGGRITVTSEKKIIPRVEDRAAKADGEPMVDNAIESISWNERLEKSGSSTSYDELELQEVLLQRLEDIVVEMKELGVL